jgi:hypothetical protein
LFVGRHNLPFFRPHFASRGGTMAVQPKRFLKKLWAEVLVD